MQESDLETLERDGVVCLRQAIDLRWIERLRDAMPHVLEAPDSKKLSVPVDGSKGGTFTRNRFIWRFNDDFRAFAFDSELPEIAAKAMRSRSSFLLLDAIFVKEPHADVATPWHHDQPYGWYEGEQTCQFWVPLENVDLDNGCLEFVRGSHRWGKLFNVINFADRQSENRDDENVPDIDTRRDQYDIIHFDLAPGDCLLFSELMVHSSRGNGSPRPRAAVSVHYAGDDARYVVRPQARKPVVDPGIQPGDPFGCHLFPRVWPKTGS